MCLLDIDIMMKNYLLARDDFSKALSELYLHYNKNVHIQYNTRYAQIVVRVCRILLLFVKAVNFGNLADGDIGFIVKLMDDILHFSNLETVYNNVDHGLFLI